MPAWRLYCICSTQWVIGGLGSRIGLNYPSVFATMTELKIPDDERQALFEDIRIIEAAVLEQQAQETT